MRAFHVLCRDSIQFDGKIVYNPLVYDIGEYEANKWYPIRSSRNQETKVYEREHCLFYFDYIYESFGEAWEDTIVPMSRKHITTVFFT